MSNRPTGKYYPDISAEFEMARINYGLFEKDGKKMLQKDFDPTANPSMINNVVAGRASNDELRARIEKFTKKWYWDFNKKTEHPEEP